MPTGDTGKRIVMLVLLDQAPAISKLTERSMNKSTENGSTVVIISVPVRSANWSIDAVFHRVQRQLSLQYGWDIADYVSAEQRRCEDGQVFYDYAFEIVDLI